MTNLLILFAPFVIAIVKTLNNSFGSITIFIETKIRPIFKKLMPKRAKKIEYMATIAIAWMSRKKLQNMQQLPHTDNEFKNIRRKTKLNTLKKTMDQIIDYTEICYQILVVVVVGEILRRLYRIAYEYAFYQNYYEPQGKLWTMTKRSFSLNLETSIGLIGFLLLAIAFVTTRNSRPPTKFFLFMPLYWMAVGINIGSSHLDYANWIRQPHGLDYAEGMASNYFHGYLKLTLPSHTGHMGLRERIELYEAQHQVKFAVKRLVILVPNTMFVNSKIESKILERDGVKPLETVVKNRAGVARPFKNDVYRFKIPINGTYFYVAVEGATPMLSFFEAMNFQPSTTWQMKEMQREILLKFYKHLKKLLNEWPETQEEAELVLYNTYKEDGRPQDVGEVLLSHITNMWNEGRT